MDTAAEETQMPRKLILLALLLFVASGASASDNTGIARFREIERTHTEFGEFAGSTETWRTTVLLRASGSKVVGNGLMACTRIETLSPARECMGTYRLPEGSIQVAGVFSSRTQFTLLITGATGVYEGKPGTVTVSTIAVGPRQAFVTFYLK
jgi:hypothetical protein